MICSVEDCAGAAGIPGTARGLCRSHYYRLMKWGSVDAPLHVTVKRDPTCTIEGCEQKHRARGFCGKHLERWRVHGDPRVVATRRGERHHRWAGSAPSYEATHKRTRRIRGLASRHECAHCTAQAAQWAYDHADPNELVGDDGHGKQLPYSADPDHYLPLCLPCHKRLDRKHTLTQESA